MADRYTPEKQLGLGAYGYVCRASRVGTNKKYAVKHIPYSHMTRHVATEILNQRQLVHPHLIRFEECFEDADGINIVMEYADQGSLLDHVRGQPGGRLAEGKARWYFQQLAIALDYCHQKNIGHRDLKLENTLLATNGGDKTVDDTGIKKWHLVKICDFGFAKAEQLGTAAHSRVGTPNYMAPDVLLGGAYNPKKADIWSLGVMLYAMLSGRHAFPPAPPGTLTQQQKEILRERMLQGCPDFPPGVILTEECINLLHRLLNPDPSQRITMNEILDHPWVVQNLPPDALKVNPRYLAMPPSSPQSEQEIAAVVERVLEQAWSNRQRSVRSMPAAGEAGVPQPQEAAAAADGASGVDTARHGTDQQGGGSAAPAATKTKGRKRFWAGQILGALQF